MILLYRGQKYCSYTVYESQDTIHTFKNYFATIFSVFSFSNNKFNPNGPIEDGLIIHLFDTSPQ